MKVAPKPMTSPTGINHGIAGSIKAMPTVMPAHPSANCFADRFCIVCVSCRLIIYAGGNNSPTVAGGLETVLGFPAVFTGDCEDSVLASRVNVQAARGGVIGSSGRSSALLPLLHSQWRRGPGRGGTSLSGNPPLSGSLPIRSSWGERASRHLQLPPLQIAPDPVNALDYATGRN